MTSAGDRLDAHLQLVRLLMSRDDLDLDAAMDLAGPPVPAADHEEVRRRHRSQTSTTIQLLEPSALVDGGPRPWFQGVDTAQGYYWRRQRSYQAHTLHRKDFELDSLDLSSNKSLSHLENPHSPEPFTIRGLVVGHVQSGKTANFSALIAKSADAGYKVIIVLSGLHNSLRQQTQVRLERDFGRERVPGVGEPEAGRRWVWGTGAEAHGDFDPRGFNAAVLQGNEHRRRRPRNAHRPDGGPLPGLPAVAAGGAGTRQRHPRPVTPPRPGPHPARAATPGLAARQRRRAAPRHAPPRRKPFARPDRGTCAHCRPDCRPDGRRRPRRTAAPRNHDRTGPNRQAGVGTTARPRTHRTPGTPPLKGNAL